MTESNKQHQSSVPREGWRISFGGLQEAGKCWLEAACCQYWMSSDFQNSVHVDRLSQKLLHTVQDNSALGIKLVEEFRSTCGSAQVFVTWL